MTRHDAAQPGWEDFAHVPAQQHDRPPGIPGERRAARGQLERPALAGRLRASTITRGEPARVRSIRPAAAWSHRLRLTGELGAQSAVALEAEIEALCESGIDELVVDLAGLEGIDATGARVLALRGELCRRRGVAFALVGVGAEVRRALVAAGFGGPAGPEGDENPQRKERKIGQKG
jgi:anti-anti-sigma factor